MTTPGPRRRTGVMEADGEQLYFEVTGEGEPVVLTHGMGSNHGSWWQQVLPLTRAGLQVVTWDQRGFGNSTRRSGVFGPAPAVGDLERLLDHLDLPRVHLVGQSMGGWVAMGVALRSPDRLASLVLSDTLAGVFTDDVLRAVARSAGAPGPLQTDVAGSHRALGEPFRLAHPDLAVLYEELSGYGDKPADDEMFSLLGSTRFDPGEVKGLEVATLLIAGEHDHLCPPAAMRAMADLLTDAAVTIIEGCGHSPYFEDAAAFNAAVIEFVGQHPIAS